MHTTTTVLFDHPQREIATLISGRISQATSVRIVTGFATPGGIAAISPALKTRPSVLSTLIVGSATYSGFQALDDLIAAGVPLDRLFVHLGHTKESGGRKNPFERFHPMLHSKIYYMEFSDSSACAFIGSHNVTSYALTGLNGEAAIMLEGHMDSLEFQNIRSHIQIAQQQAVSYSAGMKEAYAWWIRQFLDGLKAELGPPVDWTSVRTILIFAESPIGATLRYGDQLYFEIPAGIEQIDSLNSETHLFVFYALPPTPQQALHSTHLAYARYSCRTLGAENKQGNLEVRANWRIDLSPTPALHSVPGAIFRPTATPGMQQVRAEVQSRALYDWEYMFERERQAWDPEFSKSDVLHISPEFTDRSILDEARLGVPANAKDAWKLVTGLAQRTGSARERDQEALDRASPESGSFILVSLRRRRKE